MQDQPDDETRDEHEHDKLRRTFRSLVIANPNYFGNLGDTQFKPVIEIAANTSYEHIGCVGYHPEHEKLHAVVYLTRNTGYGGDICTNGSTEFVRFYLSFDGGATWDDQGVSSFKAHDIRHEAKRLEYAVTRRVDPPRKFCFVPNLIKARAILSWNQVPPAGDPSWKPVWGDVHDTNIEIDPLKFVVLDDLLPALDVPIPAALTEVVGAGVQVPVVKQALTLQQRAKLYDGVDVEPSRFAFSELTSLVDQPALAADLIAPGGLNLLPDLGIDWPDLGDLFAPTDGNVSFEELECIGYDDATSSLVGVLRVKKPSGYSGGPCTAGSVEYVTFWADLNHNGTFETCLGTASVTVHDYDRIPEGGLEYSVSLRVFLDRLRKDCQSGPVLIPIRATLSWNTPVACSDPNKVPVWGNREETLIELPPGPGGSSELPVISTVADMATPEISSTGYATGLGVETGFSAEGSPFGGRVDIAGKIVNGTSTSKYRVVVKPHGAADSAYVPITVEPTGLKLTLITTPPLTIDTNHVVHADSDGYYPYEDYASNHFVEGNLLMRWHTGAAEDGQTFDLRVDLSTDGNPANDIHTSPVTVRVDNTAPTATLDIALGTGVDCADFDLGDSFSGNFVATDEHFRRFWFSILPPGPANGVLPSPSSGRSVFLPGGTYADPGEPAGTYTVDTMGMNPCGYSLSIWVESRTNVNSGTARHRSLDSVGFCVRQPQEG